MGNKHIDPRAIWAAGTARARVSHWIVELDVPGHDRVALMAQMVASITAEIIRGAIEQTAWGELEAARACGMSKWQVQRHTVLPRACRRALPAYGNEAIFMLHGTAVAGVITIVDLFGAAKIVSSRHFVPVESFLTAGVFYLLLTFLIVLGVRRWERYWHAHLSARGGGSCQGGSAVARGPSLPGRVFACCETMVTNSNTAGVVR